MSTSSEDQFEIEQIPETSTVQNPEQNEKDEEIDVLANISEKITKLFSKAEKGEIKFDQNWQHPFKQHPTEVNNCTYMFGNQEQYYTCSNCCENSLFTTMCFCLDCWVPEKHIGHRFKKQTVNFAGNAYCDCGREERIKKQAFCDRHGKRHIEADINKQQQEQFVNYFFELFKVIFASEHKKRKLHDTLLQKITKALDKLTDKSVYYCRMVIQLLKKEIKIQGEEEKWPLMQIISSKNFCKNLFFNLTADEVSKFQLVKCYVHLENSEKTNRLQGLNSIRDELFQGEEVYHKLAQEDIFIERQSDKYIKFAKNKKNIEILINFLKFLQRKDDKKQDFIRFIARGLYEEDEIIVSSQQLSLYLIEKVFDWLKVEDQNNNKREQARILLLISKIFYTLCDYQIENVNNEFLFEKYHFEAQKIDSFVSKFMQNGKDILFGQRREKPLQISIILPFIFALKQKNKNEHIAKFWKSIYDDKNQLIQMIDVTYQLLVLVSHLEMANIFNLPRQKTKNEKIQEAWDNFFRSYLYHSKQIRREEIWEMKQEKEIQYSKAGETLNELCIFNNDTESYNYISQKQYPNSLMIFNYRHRLGNVRDIKETKLDINSIIEIKDPVKKELLDLIFNCDSFFPKIKEKWDQLLAESQENTIRLERLKSFQIGRLYLIVIISVSKAINGSNIELAKEMEMIVNDVDYRFKYTYMAEETQIEKLLCLNKEEKTKDQAQEEDKEKQRQEAKKKSENKKKLLLEKFKKKGKLVLEKNISKTSNHADQDQDICLLCHEPQKISKPLVYLSSVNQDKTLCCSIYGNNSKANTLIQTCFHTIHVDCFIKMQKHNLEFSCPLCQKKGNCILPLNYNPSEKRLNKICQNVINATLMLNFKIYESDNMFILLFKHLLESKGLNSLISSTRYEQVKNRRGRIDDFILELLQEIYMNASELQAQNYSACISELLKEVKKCDKIYAQIQELFIKAIHSKISHPETEIDLELLKQLSCELQEEEYSIIKRELEELTQEPIEMEKQAKKTPGVSGVSFNIVKLPPTSAQLSTFGKEKCKYCSSSEKYFLCLICGENMCRQCSREKSHREETHSGNWLFFVYDDAVMVMETKQTHEVVHLYMNQFMMPYEMRGSCAPDQIFKLNQVKLSKSIDKFLESV